MAGNRPGGVTLVAVLAWISGVLNVLGGILLLIGVGAGETTVDGMDVGGGVGAAAAWISIIIGILTIAVGLGLLRGANIARIIAAIVFILNVISAVYLLVTQGVGNWTAIISGILAVIALILLFSPKANAFFRS
ncbi:hypothetical protein [Microbacterium sp. SLBN-146]|uniref:DUF7144 family membrane protein n=1 Tax=Microbacterium sp. SLBN-146 TaxID=2768457 RepID=UPI00114D9052|nr:hypothetical protein [Microbacterium sp. SLBN-146]TQJ32114.1 hypothetical protein FBY39_2614 [Microbacterium sp. SLBN-146]